MGSYLYLNAKSIVEQSDDETECKGVAKCHGGTHCNVSGFARSACRINGADAVKELPGVADAREVGLVNDSKQEYTDCPNNA